MNDVVVSNSLSPGSKSSENFSKSLPQQTPGSHFGPTLMPEDIRVQMFFDRDDRLEEITVATEPRF